MDSNVAIREQLRVQKLNYESMQFSNRSQKVLQRPVIVNHCKNHDVFFFCYNYIFIYYIYISLIIPTRY